MRLDQLIFALAVVLAWSLARRFLAQLHVAPMPKVAGTIPHVCFCSAYAFPVLLKNASTDKLWINVDKVQINHRQTADKVQIYLPIIRSFTASTHCLPIV